MKPPGNDGNIPFMDTKYSLNLDQIINTCAYRKALYIDCHLDLKKINHANRAKKQSSIPLVKEIKMIVPLLKLG